MKSILSILMILYMASGPAPAQDTTRVSTPQQETPPQKQPKPQQPLARNKIYIGGNMALTVGRYTRIGVYPLIGYKVTPKLSGGLKIGYEYIRDNRWSETYETSNYGGSIFARYRIVPQLYAHVEYAQINYELYDEFGHSDRQWVPFLYVGGGYSRRLGGNVWLNAQVLFDVLQDDRSPYRRWDPVFSIGVAAGF
jgi:hypothetical protein